MRIVGGDSAAESALGKNRIIVIAVFDPALRHFQTRGTRHGPDTDFCGKSKELLACARVLHGKQEEGEQALAHGHD